MRFFTHFFTHLSDTFFTHFFTRRVGNLMRIWAMRFRATHHTTCRSCLVSRNRVGSVVPCRRRISQLGQGCTMVPWWSQILKWEGMNTKKATKCPQHAWSHRKYLAESRGSRGPTGVLEVNQRTQEHVKHNRRDKDVGR